MVRSVWPMYSLLFHYMEDEGLLDPNNEIHMFCLHYIYLPRINSALNLFLNAWNNHPMSSEGNLSCGLVGLADNFKKKT